MENPSKQCCLIAIIITVTFCHLTTASTDNCWIDDATCLVHATLYKGLNAELELNAKGDTLPLNIDCATTQNDASTVSMTTSVTQPPEYLLKRFERAFGLTLNGCHKGLQWQTFGFEFLPNCDKITELTVELFHTDVLYTLQCPGATFMQLEILHFQHNKIATITAAAISNLSLLRELYFVSNALRHVEGDAFNNLHFIEHIHLEHEPLLAIKDKLLFQRTNVADLRLIFLKHVTSTLFENLPETLLNLTVVKTPIGAVADALDDRDVNFVYVNNPRLLRNVTIIDCDLRVFKLNDMHGSVLFLNLSGNKLTEFVVSVNGTNATTELQILDLSNNQLTHLPVQLMQPHMLQRLQKLFLQNNFLKHLPLLTLLGCIPEIRLIDLTTNKLEYLLIESKANGNEELESDILYRVRIRIDDNPWNCKWLLEFAHAHPDKFRVFQYEKFLSQINVNGLACLPVDTVYEPTSTNIVDVVVPNGAYNFSLNANDTYLNISTFTLIYGSPWDVKRNQRTEALIIVFMLPVGIAILFLMLYLWVYCQKVFHLSYYQKCPLLKRRRSQPRTITVANRFDVVRQLPPNSSAITLNNNEGYELPLNGIAPICNCIHSGANSTNSTNNACHVTNEKCQKIHHITYVPLPDEHAQQIYEEIVASDEEMSNDAVDPARQVHPIYDHLTFE